MIIIYAVSPSVAVAVLCNLNSDKDDAVRL